MRAVKLCGMIEGTQRRLAAIVSADVVGYSRLMGADEDGTHARLRSRFIDVVEPMVCAHSGRVVKLNRIDGADWEYQEVLVRVEDFDLLQEQARAPYADSNDLLRYMDGLRKAAGSR